MLSAMATQHTAIYGLLRSPVRNSGENYSLNTFSFNILHIGCDKNTAEGKCSALQILTPVLTANDGLNVFAVDF